MATLEFLGATGTVTGSKYLIETGTGRLLVDCGLYQGLKALRLRHWEPLPVDPPSIDWVVLTTADLLKILLPDSGHLQEEEAAYHNKRGTTKHTPALPLYTTEEGLAAAERVEGVDYRVPLPLAERRPSLLSRSSWSTAILGRRRPRWSGSGRSSDGGRTCPTTATRSRWLGPGAHDVSARATGK